MNIIETKNLSVGYKNFTLLENININVKEKSCVCIYGENGCGKTTFLKTLLGFIPPVSGTAFINNYPLSDIWKIRKISSFVFQNNETNFDFPILAKDVVLMGRYRNNPMKTDKNDLMSVEKIMKDLNLWDLRDIPYSRLSGGQKQRINIALALAGEPKILFLDEPGTFLDTQSRDILINTINRLKQEITLLVVSHYKYFTDSIADEIYNLENFKKQE